MEYIVKSKGDVNEEFVERTKRTVDEIARRMGIDDLFAIFLNFYHSWEEFEQVRRTGLPVPPSDPGLVSAKYRGIAASARLVNHPAYGIVGDIHVVEELLKDVDDKVFRGRLGHEVGHIKGDIEEGYRTSDLYAVNYLLRAFRPYFGGRDLLHTVKACCEVPKDYHAERNLLDIGFVEESFAKLDSEFVRNVEYIRVTRSNKRLIEINEEIRARCPYCLLSRAWYHLSTQLRSLAIRYALISHESTPEPFKESVKRQVEEHENALSSYYRDAYRRMRKDFFSDPEKFLEITQIPTSFFPHMRMFTKEYAGTSHLPTYKEQERMTKKKFREIKKLVIEHDTLLKKIVKKIG